MIKINGAHYDLNGGKLIDFIESKNYGLDKIVVEYNGDILQKTRLSDVVFADGDEVEIVCFVGGG